MQSNLPLLVSLLLAVTHSYAAPSQSQTPSPTFSNGTVNPFYPCGATVGEIAACPYRCYTASGKLQSQCYTQQSAKIAIESLQNICVKCEIPNQPEDQAGKCRPLETYFNTTDKFGSRPSPCGFKNHRLRNCAWICGEAQVPFEVCSATNTTSMFSLCEKCLPQCSSPRIVFDPPFLPSNFSLSAGSCSTQYGKQEIVACPFRCTTLGDPNSFCSLDDKTDNGPNSFGFTKCISCK